MRLLLTLLLSGCTSQGRIGRADQDPPLDQDQDGAFEDDDCDDGDPHIYPGAAERCDGSDNNCDGLVDGIRPTPGGPLASANVCEQTASFTQDLRLDLLFVIDSTNSMLDAQVRVAEGIHDLLQWVLDPKFDTHVGAISMDMESFEAQGQLVEVQGYSFADNGLDIPVEEWAADALVLGIEGRGTERPFDAILAALTEAVNPGFRRQDAHLSVVVISDEDDDSNIQPIDFLTNFRARLGPRGGAVHALIKDFNDGPSCDEVVAESVISVSEATGGLRGSICSPDFGAFLSPVGQTSAQKGLNTRFQLTTVAQRNSVLVEVQYPGGLVEPLNPNADFALSPRGDELILLGTPPVAGSRINVRWLAVPGTLD